MLDQLKTLRPGENIVTIKRISTAPAPAKLFDYQLPPSRTTYRLRPTLHSRLTAFLRGIGK